MSLQHWAIVFSCVQVALTLAEKVLTPPKQDVKVLDVAQVWNFPLIGATLTHLMACVLTKQPCLRSGLKHILAQQLVAMVP